MNNEFKGIFDDNDNIEIDEKDLEINYQWDNEDDEYDDFEQEVEESVSAITYGFNEDIFMSEDEYIKEQKEIHDLMFQLEMRLWDYPNQVRAVSYFDNGERVFQEGALDKLGYHLKRIWNVIKKIFNWIRKQISRFINFIKRKSGKQTKSVDQILREMNINPSAVKGYQEMFMEGATETLAPSDELSTVQPPKIISIAKSLILEFTDNNTVKIKKHDVDEYIKDRPSRVQPAQEVQYDYTYDIVHYMRNPQQMDRLIAMSAAIRKLKNDNSQTSYTNNAAEACKNDGCRNNNHGIRRIGKNYTAVNNYEFSINDFREFQKKLNTIMQNLSWLDDNNVATKNISKEYFEFFKELSGEMRGLQMGLNTIAGAFTQSFVVDKRYQKSISDVKQLDTFTAACIRSGIPGRFIASAVYTVSADDIRGDAEHSKPIWGQSRVIFRPKNNESIVHKIALSGWGIQANKTEAKLSAAIDKFPHDNWKIVARIIHSYPNYAVVDAQRILAGKDANISSHDERQMQRNAEHLYVTKPEMKIAIGDIHHNNIGRDKNTGKILIIDYGLTGRFANK